MGPADRSVALRFALPIVLRQICSATSFHRLREQSKRYDAWALPQSYRRCIAATWASATGNHRACSDVSLLSLLSFRSIATTSVACRTGFTVNDAVRQIDVQQIPLPLIISCTDGGQTLFGDGKPTQLRRGQLIFFFQPFLACYNELESPNCVLPKER
jgi:hypothetical protein